MTEPDLRALAARDATTKAAVALIDAEREKVRVLREAGEQARAALYLVLRGLRAGHVKAKAVVPREGPLLSLQARIEPVHAAVVAARATTEPKP